MAERSAARVKHPDQVMHELNYWWSEGFRCGILQRLHSTVDDASLTGARRDQFYHGLRAGREARQ